MMGNLVFPERLWEDRAIMMDPERWMLIERLYHTALERGPGEREAYLRQVCGQDADLLREIEELIAYQARASTFLQVPAARAAAQGAGSTETVRLGETAGTVIGRVHPGFVEPNGRRWH
jgi:hypothetical protein